MRVPVRAELFAWARDRSRVSPVELGTKFPALEEWEAGTKQPTLKQLEKFAQATHTPIGYLFLGSAVTLVDDCCGCQAASAAEIGEGELELDGRELAEAPLTATAVVGVLDPVDDRVGEFVPASSSVPVEDVLLEQ